MSPNTCKFLLKQPEMFFFVFVLIKKVKENLANFSSLTTPEQNIPRTEHKTVKSLHLFLKIDVKTQVFKDYLLVPKFSR